ncbi:STAS domain-containing protein [Halalkalibacillus halophilus]|uniref:STAS domain-containing protein n=1 Tax=Halalkalibacillus halophilus TaxID=392827 RepID=UPI00040065A9|nr:STAS domain-containing protein [Halalkalibacillus halophilus]
MKVDEINDRSIEIGQIILQKRSSISSNTLDQFYLIYRENEKPTSQDYVMMETIVRLIGRRLLSDQNEQSFKHIQRLGYRAGKKTVHSEAMLHETFQIISHVSEGVWQALDTEASIDLKKEDVILVNKQIETVILQLMIGYLNSFMDLYKEVSSNFNDKLNELSIPIIRVDDGVGVCPIIGEIDSDRAAILMDQTLKKVTFEAYDHLIFDLSGISQLDDYVVKYLFDTVYSMQLMGINVIFTGIRAKLAMKAVHLNFDLTKQQTFSNVKNALEHIKTLD